MTSFCDCSDLDCCQM